MERTLLAESRVRSMRGHAGRTRHGRAGRMALGHAPGPCLTLRCRLSLCPSPQRGKESDTMRDVYPVKYYKDEGASITASAISSQ